MLTLDDMVFRVFPQFFFVFGQTKGLDVPSKAAPKRFSKDRKKSLKNNHQGSIQ